MQPTSLYEASNLHSNLLPNFGTVLSSPSLQSTNTMSPSWDSQTERDISPFPTALQAPTLRNSRNTIASPGPAIRHSRDNTSSPGPIRIQKPDVRSKSRKAKALAKSISQREKSTHWPRHILVRAKILPHEATTEYRYFMVMLHSPDVQLCAQAICQKLGIDSTGYKTMRWTNKRSCSWGVVDSTFLVGLDEMQDFVVDVVGVGNNGYVELLLEMWRLWRSTWTASTMPHSLLLPG